jgi:hypothetical protein
MATQSSHHSRSTFKPIPNHAHSHYARHLIAAHHDKIIPFLPLPHRLRIDDFHNNRLVQFKTPRKVSAAADDIIPVGILGAGPGGLYAAMILQSLGIKYQILEASGRTGGRLYTHHFSNQPFDYYVSGFSDSLNIR